MITQSYRNILTVLPAIALAGLTGETVANDLKSTRNKMCFGYCDPESLERPISFCFSYFSQNIEFRRKIERESDYNYPHTSS